MKLAKISTFSKLMKKNHKMLKRKKNLNIYYDNYPLDNDCDDNWIWNVKDKSFNIVRLYGSKRRIALIHPSYSCGSEGVRGNRILNNARFYWELNVSMKICGFR